MALTAALGDLQQNYLRLAGLFVKVKARMCAKRWEVGAVPSSPAEMSLWLSQGSVQKL